MGVKGQFPEKRGKTSNRAKGVPFTNSLKKALKQYDTGDPKGANALRKISDNLIEQALNPSSEHYQFAVKTITERIDGSPKRGEDGSRESAAEILRGISAAVTALDDFRTRGTLVNGETVVQDRSVLPAEVRPTPNGHGEGVDLSKVSGSSGES